MCNAKTNVLCILIYLKKLDNDCEGENVIYIFNTFIFNYIKNGLFKIVRFISSVSYTY
jgi:hypothetical protein